MKRKAKLRTICQKKQKSRKRAMKKALKPSSPQGRRWLADRSVALRQPAGYYYDDAIAIADHSPGGACRARQIVRQHSHEGLLPRALKRVTPKNPYTWIISGRWEPSIGKSGTEGAPRRFDLSDGKQVCRSLARQCPPLAPARGRTKGFGAESKLAARGQPKTMAENKLAVVMGRSGKPRIEGSGLPLVPQRRNRCRCLRFAVRCTLTASGARPTPAG